MTDSWFLWVLHWAVTGLLLAGGVLAGEAGVPLVLVIPGVLCLFTGWAWGRHRSNAVAWLRLAHRVSAGVTLVVASVALVVAAICWNLVASGNTGMFSAEGAKWVCAVLAVFAGCCLLLFLASCFVLHSLHVEVVPTSREGVDGAATPSDEASTEKQMK